MGQVDRGGKGAKKRYYVVEMVEGEAPPLNAKTLRGVVTRKKQRLHPTLKKIGYIVLGVAVLGVIGTVTLNHFKGGLSNPIPATIKRSTPFPLYYSSALPHGYEVDQSSIKKQEERVSYSLVSGDGKTTVIVSQQAIPKDFDPKSMFSHNPLPTSISQIGTIYDLSYKDQSRYMLVTSESLIFIGMNGKISTDQLQEILDGLKAT